MNTVRRGRVLGCACPNENCDQFQMVVVFLPTTAHCALCGVKMQPASVLAQGFKWETTPRCGTCDWRDARSSFCMSTVNHKQVEESGTACEDYHG